MPTAHVTGPADPEDRSAWPVVVTTACARMCAEGFGLPDPHSAKAWISGLVKQRGLLTEKLPAQFGGRRSPSGSFVVVAGLFAIGLAYDRDGGKFWVGTSCYLDPGHRREVDVTALSGSALLATVEITRHIVERFQQRAGGDPDAAVARRQLLSLLEATASARSRPPRWVRTTPADAYLVGGAYEQFVVPCRRAGGVRTLSATTLLVRDSELFELGSGQLAAKCRFPDKGFAPGSAAARHFGELIRCGAGLRWHPPAWVSHPEPQATWWVVPSRGRPRLAAPVIWRPGTSTPLTVLGIRDGRPWISRLLAGLRRRPR